MTSLDWIDNPLNPTYGVACIACGRPAKATTVNVSGAYTDGVTGPPKTSTSSTKSRRCACSTTPAARKATWICVA